MSLSNLTFLWAWMILLAPLLWLVRRQTQTEKPESQAVRIPFYEQLAMLQGINALSSDPSSHHRQVWLTWLAWLCVVLALMRPAWEGDPVEIATSGRDLMLAVDISPSMKEQDMIIKGFQTTRLEAVKQVVSDFIDQRKGDRLGLILFGERPYVQTPLTFDRQTVNRLLQEAWLGMAGSATAIGDAIGLAVKRLRDRPAESRVLILLTDGANTAGEVPPIKAAELAAKEHIRIYTIGIGADEMLKRGFFANQVVNPSADLDENTLTEIARLTDGQYFRARSVPELELIYEAVNRLEPVEQDTRTYRPEKELYYWPLSLAALLLSLRILTRIRLRRS